MIGVGVDIVAIDRVTDAAKRSSGRLLTRLCNAAEQAWVAEGDSDARLAATFAMKEAWIKANGARPPGFSWSACALDFGPAAVPAWLASAADVVPQRVGGLAGGWRTRDGDVIAFVGETTGAEVALVDVVSADESRLTPREREYCAGHVTRIAGRLAAKDAVQRLVGISDAEVLPGSHPVDSPLPCRGESHPPVVALDGELAVVRVSISHSTERAVAVAFY